MFLLSHRHILEYLIVYILGEIIFWIYILVLTVNTTPQHNQQVFNNDVITVTKSHKVTEIKVRWDVDLHKFAIDYTCLLYTSDAADE